MELMIAGHNVRRILGNVAVSILEEQMDYLDI